MPYYVVEVLVPQCAEIGCKRGGVCEVRNPQNEVVGPRWCKPHADRRVEDLNEGRVTDATSGGQVPKWAQR